VFDRDDLEPAALTPQVPKGVAEILVPRAFDREALERDQPLLAELLEGQTELNAISATPGCAGPW
jgi:hypothetical protein